MRHQRGDKVSNPGSFLHDIGQIDKLLYWANQYDNFAYFNPNEHKDTLYKPFDHILAAGKKAKLISSDHSFQKLDAFLKQHPFSIGYLSYDLKNELFPLQSDKASTIASPNLSFFAPEEIISFDEANFAKLSSLYENIAPLAAEYLYKKPKSNKPPFNLECSTSKEAYLTKANQIKRDIKNGAYYEINYCIEFTVNNIDIDPVSTYMKLNKISPMPFSVLLKDGTTYIICASPERFLKKNGDKLISQPIKGTIKRGITESEDELMKSGLLNSEKERAENMMIVDLVRNDLSRSAIPGSVKVDEMFGIYSFKHIHQMISTVSSTLLPGYSFTDIIKNTFPMGSMTGAPKLRVMQQIENIEPTNRGIYAGTIGYIKPNGDFDFNVVIRSIIYDKASRKLSFHVGSAITYDAEPEKEYDECMLKAESMVKVLQNI